ncbi:MAG: FAD-dependent thymidylate synthase [bacterium]
MLDVKLAGYNVDTEVLNKLKSSGWDGKNNVSPETISAAYARISRDPRPVGELRADSREEVDRARKSNEAIVFKMGHHSVAEHAVLNFDILGLSRLAVETLQEARLCSYTEKSQRYITLNGDYVVPEDFTFEDQTLFKGMIDKQVAVYKKLFPVLHAYQKKKNPDMLTSKSGENVVEGWAKEDARYALGMATECQLGFTSNSRNLEHIIRKLKYSPLAEVRVLGQKLYDCAKEIVPSLIILSDPEAFKKQFGKEVSDGILMTGKKIVDGEVKKVLAQIKIKEAKAKLDTAKMLYFTEEADIKIIAGMLHTATLKPFAESLAIAKKLGKTGREKFIKSVLAGLTEHDALYREFENVNFVMEVVLSSSAFAQLKRHRMMSMTKQVYVPALGYTIPPAIKEIKQTAVFEKIMDETNKVFGKLKKNSPAAAEYILTNAHRRRVIVNANLREVYHIARLRMDTHAQWDIQNVSAAMVEIVKKEAPLCAALACGKDTFYGVKKTFLEK